MQVNVQQLEFSGIKPHLEDLCSQYNLGNLISFEIKPPHKCLKKGDMMFGATLIDFKTSKDKLGVYIILKANTELQCLN